MYEHLDLALILFVSRKNVIIGEPNDQGNAPLPTTETDRSRENES
jgi:hypothetical protein